MTPRDPFADLQSALSLTPSPEFAARVRARVAAAPSSRSPLSVWAWGALAAAALAAIVTASVIRTRSVVHPVDVVYVAAAPEPAVANAEPTQPTPVAAVPRQSTPRVVPVVARPSVVAGDPFYEVIVPDDQRKALERLLLAMKTGRASVPRATVTTEVDEDGNTVIVPLPGIVPMKIEPLAGTPADYIKREEIKKER